MSKIYLYPKSGSQNIASNPYVFYLEKSLSQNHIIVNKGLNRVGVIDFFRYLFRVQQYLFNWIEDLPQKRYGKLQVIFFVIFLFCAKLFGKEIIWVLHNRYSHDKTKNKWTDFMYRIMIRKSDFILTHSKSGIDLIKENYFLAGSKVAHIMHPVREFISISNPEEKEIDLLIWGTISPYKGILEFLKYISETKIFDDKKIVIIGSCSDKYYNEQINKHLSQNVAYYNRPFNFEEIKFFVSKSKFILFTYLSDTVLSSGSLMDSIGMKANIIAPNFGSFKDLNSYRFIKTYEKFDDIKTICDNFQSEGNLGYMEAENFCKENTWDLFAQKFDAEMYKILKK